MSLLSPKFLQRLSALRLRSNRRAAGVRVGERKSIRRGQSQEFADHRPYVPGDDLRFLDWHLYGRLDTLWVKLFEEESDRTLQILMDCSASMQGEKIEYAKKVAGALSFVALGHSDRVVVAGLNEALSLYSPARRGRRATKDLFDTLVSIQADGKTNIPKAYNAVPRQQGASIRLFFTDFLFEEGVELTLKKLQSRGGELHVFHLFSPFELRPSLHGDVLLVDQETGEEMAFSANPQMLKKYAENVRQWADEVEAKCRKQGVGYSRLVTSVPVEELVMDDLRKQGIVS